MQDMSIERIEGKAFGATVTGVELRNLGDDEFAAIHAAFLEHGFLLFPGQHLNEQESADFGRRWGELEFGGQALANQRKHKDGTYGEIFDIDSQLMRTNLGNEAWHTDSTYKPYSSKCAMLSAVIVPDEGGQTELADMRSAYAELDEATKDRIADLSAYHSTNYSQANDLGDFPQSNGEGAYGTVYHGEAYLRPLVKIHPETGIPSLFVGRHAFGIPGLPREESRALLRSLMEFVVADERRVYRHDWTPGDTLFWDNRFVLHRARPYDYSKPRYLIGTRVAGDASELAYLPDDPRAEAGRQALAAELAILRTEAADRRYGATTAAR
ncbi:MAG: TauD/TfdA family dioxygenase [Acidimicrobiales bacterium]|nr:TauD/TfdA family dioxygenase [Acidimicrobiales bacterium]